MPRRHYHIGTASLGWTEAELLSDLLSVIQQLGESGQAS